MLTYTPPTPESSMRSAPALGSGSMPAEVLHAPPKAYPEQGRIPVPPGAEVPHWIVTGRSILKIASVAETTTSQPDVMRLGDAAPDPVGRFHGLLSLVLAPNRSVPERTVVEVEAYTGQVTPAPEGVLSSVVAADDRAATPPSVMLPEVSIQYNYESGLVPSASASPKASLNGRRPSGRGGGRRARERLFRMLRERENKKSEEKRLESEKKTRRKGKRTGRAEHVPYDANENAAHTSKRSSFSWLLNIRKTLSL